MGSTKYITSMGELSRKDNSLCFRKNGKNIYIPIENTKEIYCLNEVSFNSKLLDFFGRNNIIVHFFNYYGGYSGSFYPRNQYNSGKLLVKQVEKYKNNRIDIAKAIVKGIGANIDEVLYHYYKHGKSEVKDCIDWIREDLYKLVDKTESIKELLAYEGEIWMKFYSMFQYFINEDFVLNKRVKRPPDNMINTMISFLNTLVYTACLSEIYVSQLNPTISYLHSVGERRFSLSLDIAEVFKPLLADRIIFSLLNKKMITEKDFVKDSNYFYMKENAQKLILKTFNERLETSIKHRDLNRKVSYRHLMRLEAYKLVKHLLEDKKYEGFKIWW